MVRKSFILSFLVLANLPVKGQVPTITSFSPTSGAIGTTVTISGSNFSATPANNVVYFGAAKAVVGTASSIQLVVTVPSGSTYHPISVFANGLQGFSTMPFTTTLSGTSGISAGSFASKMDFSTGLGPWGVAMGDLDGDGKVDLITTNVGDGTTSMFRNTSSGTGSISYASAFNIPGGSGPHGAAVGDLDGDGKLDLAVANGGGDILAVMRNTSSVGSINFSVDGTFTVGDDPYPPASGDIDGDGKLDIVIANSNEHNISVLRNISTTGSIVMAPKVNFVAGTNSYPTSVAVGDLDGDGKPDVTVTSTALSQVSVFRNTSTPGVISFASKLDFTTATQARSVVLGDLDGDGKLDMAVACSLSDNVSVFRNTSGGAGLIAFTSKQDFSTGSSPWRLSIADLDGDGRADLAVTNEGSNSLSILRNTSSGIGTLGFATKVDFATGASPYSIAIGDQDGDGKAELVTANRIGNSFSVFRNQMLAPEPTTQPGPITFFHITSTQFDASWTEPNPAPDGYLAVISANVAPTFVPVDGVPYTYNQVVGAVSGNNMYVVQNTSEPGIDLSSLTLGETIHVKVYAFNGAGPTINYLTTSPLTGSQTPTADLVKPVVTNATPTTVASNASLVFRANFTDDGSGIDFAEVEYRPITAAASDGFQLLEMFPTTGSTFEIDIPPSEVGELGVEYRFIGTDFEGNDNTIAQTTYTTRVRHEEGLVIPYTQPGRTVAAYRIVAVPLILDDKSLNTVMGRPYDPTLYAAYYWTGTGLEELNDETQLQIGRGYWFIAGIDINPGIYTGPGVTPDVSPSNPFQITLTPGWNQIGNPYNFDISWSDILQANPTQLASLGGINSKIRVFRGTADNVDELVTFEGGFVKNTSTSNVTIDIPVEKNPAINSRKANAGPLRNAIDQPSWEIMFSLSQGDATYNLGGLGMRPDADIEYDTFDDFNLPRFFEYLEVKFPKELVGMTYTKDIVPTTENFVWNFSVESNIGAGPISIGWDNSYFGSGKGIYLVDLEEHRVVDMLEAEKYAFNPSSSRQFKLVYGDEEFVKNEILPGQPVLFSPYPNPFTERVTIGYSLPKEAVTQGASLDIYSGLGTRVSTVDLPAQPGEGSWEWVSEQAPGMYFVRLRMADQLVLKKIIKR